MIIIIEVQVSKKDQPRPEALPLTEHDLLSYTTDLLADEYKHSESSSWLLDRITLAAAPAALAQLRQAATDLIDEQRGLAGDDHLPLTFARLAALLPR